MLDAYNGGFNLSDSIKAYSTTGPHPTGFRNKNKYNLLSFLFPRFRLAVVYVRAHAFPSMTKHVGSGDNTFKLCFWSTGFESQQEHRLNLLRFNVVLLIPFGQKTGFKLETVRSRFFAHRF